MEKNKEYKKYPFPENLLVYARLEEYLPLTEERKKALDYVLSKMPPRREEIVRLYFAENMTQEKIGTQFGIKGSRVGYLLHEAARILRRKENRDCIDQGYSSYMALLRERETEDVKQKEYLVSHPEAIRIKDAGFTGAAERAFLAEGLKTVEEVIELLQKENYYRTFRSFGPATDRRVRERIAELGIKI